MARRWILFVFLLGWAAAGCSSFKYRSSESQLRWDRERDELVWIEIVRGLEWNAENSASAIVEVGAGRRRFPAQGGMVSIDLDKAEPTEPVEPKALDALFEWLDSNVRVDRAGLFVEPDGLLSFHRRTRIAHPGELAAAINRCIDAEISASKPEAVGDFPFYDERTRELCKAHAQKGGTWITFDQGAFRVRFPMTSHSAARVLSEIVSLSKGHNSVASQWMQQLSDLSVDGEWLSLRFAPDEQGAFVFHVEGSAEGTSESLRERVLKLEPSIRRDFTAEQAVALLSSD